MSEGYDEPTVVDVDSPSTRFDDVYRALEITDEDFHPPLSSRGGGEGMQGSGGLEAYVKDALGDGLLLAEEEETAAGVLLYHEDRDVGYSFEAVTYVDTIAVHPRRRGRGVGRRLYEKLFEVAFPPYATRTWGSNHRHLKLLDSLGFEEAHRIEGHREGDVDTVYLVRRARGDQNGGGIRKP